MSRKNKDFQKTILGIVICMLVGLLAWNIGVTVTRQQLSKLYYRQVAALMTMVTEQYPEVDTARWIQVLNDDTAAENGDELQAGRELLQRYGILSDTMPEIRAEQIQRRLQTAGNLLWLIVDMGILMGVFLYQRRRNQKVDEFVQYIRRIEQGVYQIPLDENEEEELSELKNELYKITVMLRETAELSKKQKRALSDSVSDISHQLKTPLTSCLILLDNMAESTHMEEGTRRQFLAEITRQLTSVNWLVQVLLKLSRLDAGVVELKEEEIRIQQLLEQAIDKVALLAEWKEISIQVSGEMQAVIRGDERWLQEAFINLIKNAIEHSPAKSEIQITVEDNQVYTGVRIRDYGCGISMEEQKHIFERFYRSSAAKEDSVGIGLALAQEIIKRGNGSLTVESEVGQGTTFLIKFLKCH
mgnify:FL=1